MSLKIIFAGTADFALPSLQALVDSEHQVIAVYTQPDRPAGRGQRLHASPVKQLALQHQLPIVQPLTLKQKSTQQNLQDLSADLMVVVAYGLLIPAVVLAYPRYGCLNVHGSLLPRWRGAAPIQRAILAGDTHSGVSIMQMDSGLDTGPILLQQSCAIPADMNSGELHDQLAQIGAKALITVLDQVKQHSLQARPQDQQQANYAHKINKQEAQINWQLPAYALHNLVRAFNPWPMAYTQYRQQMLRIWKSQIIATTTSAPPGMITSCSADGIDVATGDGQLRLLVIQSPGGRPIAARDFINAQQQQLQAGTTMLGEDSKFPLSPLAGKL